MPDWLYLWDDDFEALRSYVTSYVHAAVRTLKQDVHLWYLTAGTNIESELHLGEEHRLRLTLSALEVLRQADPQTPVLVGIRQPWGDYLGHTALDLSPWQFADIVVRSRLGVSGFVLEMNFACAPDRTMPRDLLELNRLLDRWSTFGLPLVVVLSFPTNGNAARQKLLVRNMRDIANVLQQKPNVQGIVWGQVSDRPGWPAGMFHAGGKVKPMWRLLTEIWRPPESDDR